MLLIKILSGVVVYATVGYVATRTAITLAVRRYARATAGERWSRRNPSVNTNEMFWYGVLWIVAVPVHTIACGLFAFADAWTSHANRVVAEITDKEFSTADAIHEANRLLSDNSRG